MVGARLKQLREDHHLTQKEVASKLHIEQPTLANYENGSRQPKLDMLVKLADLYGVSTDYLLDRVSSQTADFSGRTIISSSSSVSLSPGEEKIVDTFRRLNEDGQDILIGEAKKMLKEYARDDLYGAEGEAVAVK